MECCTQCFDDNELKYRVSTATVAIGHCKFCGSRNVPLTKVENLQDSFEFLLSFIEQSSDGACAVTIIDDYFNIFSKQLMGNKVHLLEAILDTSLAGKLYSPKWSKFHSSGHWDELRNELISKNRYFPQSSLYRTITQSESSEILSVFFKVLGLLECDLHGEESLYRARISDNPLNDTDMGAPPIGFANSGRANPFGISYLYMASTVETALSEVRPFNEGIVYVSRLLIDKKYESEPVLFINLTNPRRDVSPFVFSEDEYEYLIYSLSLLEKFSSELSKPVKPHKSELEYLPTQFICEYIKSLKYKGIIFNSSFGNGINYVSFDTDLFIPQVPTAYKINRTNYEHSET